MGLPAHLSKVACVSNEYIWDYCNRGHKNIDEMHITDLVIYDNPKDLSEFGLSRHPQSWCYVDHPTEKGGGE
jgi:predicted transcriptional regulator